MAGPRGTPDPADPFDLDRFVSAQQKVYGRVLSEIRSGQKRTHWMWYVFPQIDGLGLSATSRQYAIRSIEEARAYLNHPVLGTRLLECAEAVLAVEGRSALDIFDSPDDQKLKSCAALFASVSNPDSLFERILEKYFHGQQDGNTLWLLETLKEKQ